MLQHGIHHCIRCIALIILPLPYYWRLAASAKLLASDHHPRAGSKQTRPTLISADATTSTAAHLNLRPLPPLRRRIIILLSPAAPLRQLLAALRRVLLVAQLLPTLPSLRVPVAVRAALPRRHHDISAREFAPNAHTLDPFPVRAFALVLS